jgi:hypothetical protein
LGKTDLEVQVCGSNNAHLLRRLATWRVLAKVGDLINTKVRHNYLMSEIHDSLFSAHHATNQSNLIQYNEFTMNSALVMIGYADAARRLRDSYSAEPWDDVILLPFMFVWRQAIELALKDNIRHLAELRRQGGASDPNLARTNVKNRLRNKLGHNLEKLIDEHQLHVAALGLQEIPDDVLETLRLLAALDNGGTGFRYAGILRAPSADINFETISTALDDSFQLLRLVIDAATDGKGVDWS